MLLGLARRRTAEATAAAAAGTAWHGARDGVAALPAAFLCPVLAFIQPATARWPQDRRSTRASTSYASPQPTRGTATKARRGDNSLGVLLRRSSAIDNASVLSSGALSDVNLASKLGAVRCFSTNQTLSRGKGKRVVDKALPLDDIPVSMSVKDLQQLTLARAVVLDIVGQPIEPIDSEDDIQMLRDAADTYFDTCKQECVVLETLVPELANAFIHFGNGDEAVKLLQRYCAHFVAAGRSVSLLAWKGVLVKAFEGGDYDLTVRLIETGASGSASTDDWATYARFEALLRIAEYHLPTTLHDIHMVEMFWEEYERTGRTAPVEMFTTLIKSQARRGNVEGLKQTLKALQRHGHGIDNRIWRFMIQLHPCSRKFAVLRDLPAELGLDGSKILLELIAHFAERHDVRRVFLALRCFGVNVTAKASDLEGWKLAVSRILPVINLTASLHMTNAMIRLIHFAVQLEIDADMTPTMGNAVNSLRAHNRPQDALAISLQLTGSHPSLLQETGSTIPRLPIPEGRAVVLFGRKACSHALKACAGYKNPVEAVAMTRMVLRELYRHDLKADRKVYTELIQVFRRTLADAPWPLFATYTNKIASELGTKSDEAATFVSHLQTRGVVDAFTARGGFKLPAGARDARESLNWLTQPSQLSADVQALPAEKQASHESAGTSLTELLDGRAFNSNPKAHLLPSMSKIAYAMRLRMFSVVLRDHASAMAILRHMLQFKVMPTAMHISIIVEGLVLSNRLEEAEEVCQDARIRSIGNVEDDHRIAAAFVRAYARRGNWTAVMKQLDKMTRRGVRISPSLAASVQSKFDGFWQGRVMERYKAKRDETKLTERTLKQLTMSAQRSVMFRTLTDEERLAIQEKMANPSVLADDTGEHATERAMPLTRAPNLKVATLMYKSMFDDKRYEWAGVYMSKALDAGLLSDMPLRRVLRHSYKYLRVLSMRENLVPAQLLAGPEPLVSVQRRSLPPPDKFGNDTDAGRELAIEQRRQNKARLLSPLLQLYRQNCLRASTVSPERKAVREALIEARQAFFELLQDAFVNGTLAKEASELNSNSALPVPLYWAHSHEYRVAVIAEKRPKVEEIALAAKRRRSERENGTRSKRGATIQTAEISSSSV